MTTVLAQLAPQRSTQYGDLVSALAPHELSLSLLGPLIDDLTPVKIAGQSYLRFELPTLPTPDHSAELASLATISAFFEVEEQLEGRPGPWLHPLTSGFEPLLPAELATARRYRGKTNEVLCHFLCNIARASSHFRNHSWRDLCILDPLAGGGYHLVHCPYVRSRGCRR